MGIECGYEAMDSSRGEKVTLADLFQMWGDFFRAVAFSTFSNSSAQRVAQSHGPHEHHLFVDETPKANFLGDQIFSLVFT